MKTITTDELVTVTGGKNDQIATQLTSLQSSIKDLASSQQNTSGGSNSTMTTMMMMMALRPQPQQTVVAAPAAAPVVNIHTRVGRR